MPPAASLVIIARAYLLALGALEEFIARILHTDRDFPEFRVRVNIDCGDFPWRSEAQEDLIEVNIAHGAILTS
jgi:hypothetical protein